MKQIDELVDIGTDTPIWQRYRLKIMSLSQQVREAGRPPSTLHAPVGFLEFGSVPGLLLGYVFNYAILPH